MATIQLPASAQAELYDHLRFLYDDLDDTALETLHSDLLALLEQSSLSLTSQAHDRLALSQADVVLISYADQIRSPEASPLATLHAFMRDYLRDMLNTVHLLPFYPYSSDDGFSVIDYLAVDPANGSWQDIAALGQDFALMFDAVINHISSQSAWFQGFLADQAPYRDYFISVDPATDLRDVVRPRISPLLTEVTTAAGNKHVWTTFSADQVDVNYANPAVLLEIVAVVLEYIARGARILRLDAVTYLWKEVGTSCVHHPKTHRVLQLLRSLCAWIEPQLVLLTETNVPHEENISYFGDGHNEAHMVYNFALPPLLLHSILQGDAQVLSEWAASLQTPSAQCCFFNFAASHDGIGLRPVETLLSQEDIAALAQRAQAHGGLVSYKRNSDGSESPYELNISYMDALNAPDSDEALELQCRRFMVSQAIVLALAGVPGLYVHSVFGSRSDYDAPVRTGNKRSINRRKFERHVLEAELHNPESLAAQVYQAFAKLLRVRRQQAAFHPLAPQQVLLLHPAVFALERRSLPEASEAQRLLCLHNLSAQSHTLNLQNHLPADSYGYDLLSEATVNPDAVQLEPYQVLWLEWRSS